MIRVRETNDFRSTCNAQSTSNITSRELTVYILQLRACINNYNIVNSPDQIHGKLIAHLVAAVQ